MSCSETSAEKFEYLDQIICIEVLGLSAVNQLSDPVKLMDLQQDGLVDTLAKLLE
jgi:hypothetical protein